LIDRRAYVTSGNIKEVPMRLTSLALLAALAATPALAADPSGLWATARNDEGAFLKVRIAPCPAGTGTLCGVIESAHARDGSQSSDYAHLGKRMIADMAPDRPGEWASGTIWAPDEDATYRAKMALSGGTLRVSGCVMGGLICRGQDWTRAD
jgi:uncharacterized protein (DUF2147 family)